MNTNTDQVETPVNSGDRLGLAVTVDGFVGRELDAEVAVKLLDWEWLERVAHDGVTRKALFPPLNSGWVRVNFSPQQWVAASETAERFSDWAECCRREDGSEYRLPHFSEDIAAAMEVVEKMIAAGWWCEMGHDAEISDAKWYADFHRRGRIFAECKLVERDNLPEAICRAALAVRQNEDTKSSASDATP